MIEAGELVVDYADSGPRQGPVVLLLHGWPDDRSTWDGVAPLLNAAGLRTIIPSLRGCACTRFRRANARRSGNSAILAMDAVALLDAMGVERFDVAGHDWGSNIAEALAVGWPDRVGRIAMLSTPPRLGGAPIPPFWHARLQWYHWFMATARGEAAIRADPKGFAQIMWRTWSPERWFEQSTFDRVAVAFENPDWCDVTLHSYRVRCGEAPPDARSVWLEDKIRATAQLSRPTLYIQGAADGVNPPATTAAMAEKFTGPFERLILEGVGHFPTREAPERVGHALHRFLSSRGEPIIA